jgi:hypothetical protein
MLIFDLCLRLELSINIKNVRVMPVVLDNQIGTRVLDFVVVFAWALKEMVERVALFERL